MYNRLTKSLTMLIVFCLFLGCLPFSAAASSASLISGGSHNGMVRVRLSSLGNPASLKMTVYGSYTVNGQSAQTLPSGASVTVKNQGGRLSLTANGSTLDMGASFKLRRHAADGQNGVKIAQARVPGNLYPGDFTFTLKGSTLYIVASIYIEDYLCGVLPYEMGDTSGLEALKAQAVAARTYTLRAMSAGGSLYDVVDTTADQVYNGTPSGNANCKKAVEATKGIVVKNGGSFTPTYYTASNGGQTESVGNAWGKANQSALTVKDDPYDLRNAASVKRSFQVKAAGSQSNAALDRLLNAKAAAVFGSGAAVTGVEDVYLHTPRYASPSKLYTKLTFSVSFLRNGQAGRGSLTFDIFGELEGPLSMSINSMKNELWTVEKTASGFTVTARRYGHGIGMSQRGAMQMAKEGLSYDQILAFYYNGCTRVQYAMNRTILSPVVRGEASKEQVIPEEPAVIEAPAPAAAPAVSTAAAAPATAAPAASAAGTAARVVTPKGSLNLRAEANDSAKVLLTIPQEDTVTVLEKGSKWCAVTYAGVAGHVMSRFLSFDPAPKKEQAEATPAEVPAAAAQTASASQAAAAPQAASGLLAQVTTEKGSLKLRKAARGSAKILRTIPQYATVSVVKKNVKWTRVTYEGVTGFVMTKFLTFTDTPVAVPAAAAASTAQNPAAAAPAAGASGVTARVQTKSGSLYLRKTMNDSSKILASIPQGTEISLLKKGSKWCKTTYEGKTGYVMTRYLTFSASMPTAPAKTAAKAAAEPEKLTELKTPVLGKIVSPNGKKLNLRAACLPNARVLKQMPAGDYLTVTAVGDTWCAVEYKQKKGFCMKEYLEYTLYE